jgi:sialate O-acetylesterase
MKSWDSSVENSNYSAMLKRIRMVGGRVRGLIWYQGETDAMTPGADEMYQTALLNLVDNIRRDTDAPTLPILCVQLARFVWNYDAHARAFERIRDIQRRLPQLREGVYTVSAVDLPLEDAAHISFEGQLRLGRRLAEIALSQVYTLPGHASGISLHSIEVLKPDTRRPMLRVKFDGVAGKLSALGLPTGFEIRGELPASEPVNADPGVLMPAVYRVDFDPGDPSSLILGVFDNVLISTGGAKFHPLRGTFSLVYGPGMSPYVNIVDEQDMPVPAFGPVQVDH